MNLVASRYEIKRKIGSGSLGDVYLVRDCREDKIICLKLLRETGQDSLAALQDEFRILTQLEHPNLIRVFDFGLDESCGPYFTMEYAFGGDLGKMSGLPPDQFFKAASDICAALGFIHGRGVIHGDLKPGNILIDAEGNYRLGDFGLSSIRQSSGLTRASGTIEFVAPEVLRREGMSARSDIYSLGLLFYEMILGKPYFDGSANEIVGKKLAGELFLPQVGSEFGGSKMTAILSKMLSFKPEERHESVEHLWNEITILGNAGGSASRISLQRAPFCGRGEELAWLEEKLQVWRAGHNETALIGGDSGVGKSRLLDEFRIKIQLQGYRLFKVYCRENDPRPLSPLVKLLEQTMAELDPEMKRFAEFGPDLQRLFPERFELTGPQDLTEGDIKSGRRRLFDNLLLYLSELGFSYKAVYAIEDIQWADNDTLEFVEILLNLPSKSIENSILFLGTGQESASTKGIFSPESHKVKVLRSADEASWQDFLAGYLGGQKLPTGFTHKIYEETGGNYLFAEEVIKDLLEGGILSRGRGEWALKPDWTYRIDVPQGVREVILRRIDRLRPEVRPLVEIAAVLGRSFSSEDIFGLIGSDAGIGKNTLDELADSGVFTRFTLGTQQRMDFAHGQMRRAIYDMAPEGSRRTLHRKVAAFLTDMGAGPELLGHHYLSAGDYANAHAYMIESARAAEKIFAFGKAAEFYQSAMKCLDALNDSSERNERLFEISLGWGKALDFLSPVDATEPLGRAVSLANQITQKPALVAMAAVATGSNYLHLGDNENSVKFFQLGLDTAQRAGDPKLSGEAYTGLGFVYDKSGRLDEAEKAYLRALEFFAETDYPEGSCRVLNYMGIIRKRRGDISGAEDFYRRALDISLEREFVWLAMNLYGNLGNLLLLKNDYQRSLGYYTQSLEIARQISDRRIESINLLNIGHVCNELGELDSAGKNFFEAADKLRELGDKGSEAIVLNNLGLLFFKKGELYNSMENYKKGLELSIQIGQPRIELANRIGLAEDFAATADFQNAIIFAEKARDLAVEINDIEQLAVVLALLCEIRFEMGDLRGACDGIKEYQTRSGEISDAGQRLKIQLIKGICQLEEYDDSEIMQIVEANPRLAPIAARFRAMSALKDNRPSNPELWVARLDDAIRKAREYFMPAEVWRIMALKLRFLELLDEKLEYSRQNEKLQGELSRAMAGLGEKALEDFYQLSQLGGVPKEDATMAITKVSREERLEVLFRVARTINTIRELDPLLDKIMDLALETLSGERGFVMLYADDPAGDKTLEPVVARNLERQGILGETTISRSSALEVARSGRPLLLGRADDEMASRQSVVDFRISSILCAPLAVKGEVIGIVYVDSRADKTFNNDDLEFLVSFADLAAIAIENARMAEKLAKKNVYLQKQVESIWGFGNIVGRSPAMQKVFRMAESVAQTDVTVVISGESGTGKEILAKAIHFDSPRKNARFVPVDCGAVAETLLESELFGYVKGAFTGAAGDREGLFEVAEGGTVFLDEITNTSKSFQAKLLRVLQESEIRRVGDTRIRKIDIRMIAATNRDLEQEVKSGNFREDLYYRLNVVNIGLPPLRQRQDDIPMLAGYFLEKICKKMKLPVKTFSIEALDILLLYGWPGNVRQLENLCERLVIFAKGETISPGDLPAEFLPLKRPGAKSGSVKKVPRTKAELKEEKLQLDRLFLVGLLESTGGNVMEASRISGMDRSQIHHLISRFRLSSADFRKSD